MSTQKSENYRPASLEFDVAHDGSLISPMLGEFESAEEAVAYMNKNFVVFNNAVTVSRFMDNFEKSELRKKYNTILEERLPLLEQDAREASEKYNQAKAKKEEAIGMVNAFTTEAKLIAQEVKRGLVEMRLDEQFTWKIPYKGRYYWYTFIDFKVVLVKITDMTTTEKTELFSQGKINEDVIERGILPDKSQEPVTENEQLEADIQDELNNSGIDNEVDEEENGETTTSKRKKK